MRVAFVLCDAAQASPDGKVHILGAGWRQCGPVLSAHAVLAIISFDSNEATMPHVVALELVDEDGHAVAVPTPNGPMTVRSEGQLQIQLPPDFKVGQEIDVPFIANVGAGLPLTPGGTFVWQLWIDGETSDDWRQTFYVREATPTP